MKKLFAAAFLTLLLLSTRCLAAVDMNSAEPQTIDGQINEFLAPGLFWLLGSDGVKVLVYSNREDTKNLRIGQSVRVTGLAPQDWGRLVDQELNARKIVAN